MDRGYRMKKLIFQVNVKLQGEPGRGFKRFKYIDDMYNLSEMQAKKYAKLWNADYMQLEDCSFLPEKHPIYQRLKMYDIYKKYDQILYLDMDAIILPTCPNIFEEFSEETFSAVRNYDWDKNPEKYDPIRAKYSGIYACSEQYRPFCSGVMLLSKKFFEKTENSWREFIDSYDKKGDHDQGIFNKMIIDHFDGRFNELDEDWGPWYRSGKYIEHFGGPFKKHKFDINKFMVKHNIKSESGSINSYNEFDIFNDWENYDK